MKIIDILEDGDWEVQLISPFDPLINKLIGFVKLKRPAEFKPKKIKDTEIEVFNDIVILRRLKRVTLENYNDFKFELKNLES
jgi:hypothetical protein